MSLSIRLLAMLVAASALALPTLAQEKSVNPGINDSFLDPDVNEFTNRFEVESREILLAVGRSWPLAGFSPAKPSLTSALEPACSLGFSRMPSGNRAA